MPASKLLINEPPLQVLPSLAKAIGLNEAIILQQLHYWLTIRANEPKSQRDGFTWIYNSYPEWQKQFPWWSTDTIKRTITALEREGYLVSGNFNTSKMDKTKWYRIDYDRLEDADTSTSNESCPDDGGNLHRRAGQDAPTNTRDYQTETTNNTFSLRSNVGMKQVQSEGRHEVPFTSGLNAHSSQAAPTGSDSDRGTPTPQSAGTPLPHEGAATEAIQEASDFSIPADAPVESSKPSQADYQTVLDHIRSVQHIEKEWPNYPAQMKATKALFTAGYSVEELTTLADLMAKDQYWKKNPFSALNMVANAHKYGARLKELTEEPPMTAFEIKEEKRRATLELARQYDREHPRV